MLPGGMNILQSVIAEMVHAAASIQLVAKLYSTIVRVKRYQIWEVFYSKQQLRL